MSIVLPAFAIVRPRVIQAGSRETRLLEDAIPELAEERPSGQIRITGSFGSGKSTALAHLAAVFAHDDRLVFLDEPSTEELRICSDDKLIVATTTPSSVHTHRQLALAPWRLDELIEYLLARHHDSCASVIERLGKAADQGWLPEVARVVLDRFAADPSLNEPGDALAQQVRQRLTTAAQQTAASHFSLAILALGGEQLERCVAELQKSGCPADVRSLLRHGPVQLPLAAEHLASALATKDARHLLHHRLPLPLVETVGQRCRNDPAARERLRKLLKSQRDSSTHPMAASILYAADSSWRPRPWRNGRWFLSHGYFSKAHWPEVVLPKADLSRADLAEANLAGANLDDAYAREACFTHALLRDAQMLRIDAREANFSAANLRNAKLSKAKLFEADFSGADLSRTALMAVDLRNANLTSARLVAAELTQARLVGAVLEGADFTQAMLFEADLTDVDLRDVCLTDACLEQAVLTRIQLEDVRWPNARLGHADLRNAHLTGSTMPRADLGEANLCGAGLAEIDWEEADLRGADMRGATFHLGSSRSGLVGSPIACEGSKTGFYTDDYEAMHFKRPEEVRKANLRGADLRGARIDNLDFYLVDLRDARLDPTQLAHVRKCGAILEDLIA